MSTTDGKEWNTPKLRILARSYAVESVLQICKYAGGDGPYAHKDGCRGTGGGNCGQDCHDVSNS